jgi:hypothetical protein
MRGHILLISLVSCVLPAQPLTASSDEAGKVEEFHALIDWGQRTGLRQDLDAGIPRTLGANARRVRVAACSFDEIEENAKHVFCVGLPPSSRKFLCFISVDVGDGVSTVWRVSSRGKLISTMCFAAGSVKAVSNQEFEPEFLVEKEYFLRTMRLQYRREGLAIPATDATVR